MQPDCAHWLQPPSAAPSWLPSLSAAWPLLPCACARHPPWPSSRLRLWLFSLRQLLPFYQPLPWPSSRPRLWLSSRLLPSLFSQLRLWPSSRLPLSWPWPLQPWLSLPPVFSRALSFSSARAPWHLPPLSSRLPPSWLSALPACGLPRLSGPSLPPASAQPLSSAFRLLPCGSPLRPACAWSRQYAGAPAARPARAWPLPPLPFSSAVAVQPWAEPSAAGSAAPAGPGIRYPASPH